MPNDMTSKARKPIALVTSILIVACTSQPPTPITNVKPVNPIDRRYSTFYIPPPGQWTVRDVLQTYGKNINDSLNHYFKKADVSYPPREAILIAFKQEKKMELWARNQGEFRFIRDYFIMAASGKPGPKLHEGDRQVPEGIYRITDLNPNSHYHLSMRLNYPNDFDLFHAAEEGRTHLGSDIYIHGSNASIGCLAMGDTPIRELFILAAQVGIQNVKVVIAPHDPRAYPLQADQENLPEWTPELYTMISREIESVVFRKPKN